MKKKYIKPVVSFESFELSTNIAGTCELLSSNSAQYVCPLLVDGLGYTIFQEGSTCEYSAPGGDLNPCYDIPVSSFNVFHS